MNMEKLGNFDRGSTKTIISSAVKEDAGELINIIGDPEDLEYMMEMHEKGEGTFFVAREDDEIVGAVLVRDEYESKYNSDINGFFITGMVVREDYRRRGVGSNLLSACEVEVRESDGTEVKLSVHRKNDDAISFYENHGYKKIPDSDYVVTDEGGEGKEGQENFYMKKNF